jgi:hypothetical protein
MIKYIHNKYPDVLLTLSTHNIQAGIAAWEYTICYPNYHPDTNVF